MCFESFTYIPILYTHIYVSNLYVYACLNYTCLYIICNGWGGGGERGGEGGCEGVEVQVNRSKYYIHILYMYFILRVVYYTHVYIYSYSIHAFAGCMHICSVVWK